MAQIGSFVPATRAKLCPVDQVLVRMGASDNIQQVGYKEASATVSRVIVLS